MKIDLTCPAELWRSVLPQKDAPVCELTMYNLSDKLIVSIEVTLTLLDSAREELARVLYRAHDLRGLPEKPFTVSVPVEEASSPAAAEVVVEKIWFDDNSVWRRGKLPMSEYTSNALPNGRALENLRFIAGKDAVGYPEEQSGLWMCVCGRPNQSGSRICIRCSRNRTEVFSALTKEAVEKQTELRERQLALKGKQARESASRHQAMREKEYEEKKRRIRRRRMLVSAAAVVLLAAWGTVFHLLPYLRYRSAVELMDAGSYQEAVAAFAEMGDYRDASAQATRCTYLDACGLLTSDDADTLLSAHDVFLSLGDYEDAAAKAREADYLRAGVLLDADRAAEARDLYISLEDYPGAAEKITRCDYLLALNLLEDGEYESARISFEELGDYEDSALQAKECVYRPACAALESGDVHTAMALLEQIPGYADADTLMNKARYMHAAQLRQSGDLVAAGEAFQLAGDYDDAAQQAHECLYQAADEASRKGDHVQAAELFSRVLPYLDAQDRWNAETYQLAVDSLDDMEYIRARSLLATLPEDYQDVADLKLETLYRPAVTAFKKAQYQTALDSFLQLGDYKDSAEQALKARYRLAEELRVAGSYEAALEHYLLLGDYEDVPAQLKLTKYHLGVEYVQSARYAEAAAIFTELGKYKDSAAKLKEATYGHACALMDSGDFDTARALFESLGKYSDAKQRIPACDYGKAAAMAAAGQREEAAALFLSLGKYSDAQDQGYALYYALGTEAHRQGLMKEAAAWYELTPGYADADARCTAIYDASYAAVTAAAQKAVDEKNYPLAIAILQKVDMTGLPEKYAGLPKMYQEACYQEASRLYTAGDAYAALPYYQLIPGYRNVDEVLSRSCYLILGQWLGAEGESYLFLPDGTCSLNGEKLLFTVSTYAMQTGTAADALTLTHKVSSIDKKELNLRDIRDGQNVIIRLTRDESYVLPQITPDLPEAPVIEPEPVALPEETEEIPAGDPTEPQAAELPSPETTEDPADSFAVVDDEE